MTKNTKTRWQIALPRPSEKLIKWLRKEAQKNRRSVGCQILSILETLSEKNRIVE